MSTWLAGFKSEQSGEKAGWDWGNGLWEPGDGDGGREQGPAAFSAIGRGARPAAVVLAPRLGDPCGRCHGRGRRAGRWRDVNAAAVNRFSAVRAGYGALLLLAPDPMIRLCSGHGSDRRTRVVVRLPGVRHLAQAVLTAGSPGTAVLALGVQADPAHAASMVGLAACDRARAALVDAMGAGSFAAAGPALAWRMPSTTVPAAGAGFASRRCVLPPQAGGPGGCSRRGLHRAHARSGFRTRRAVRAQSKYGRNR